MLLASVIIVGAVIVVIVVKTTVGVSFSILVVHIVRIKGIFSGEQPHFSCVQVTSLLPLFFHDIFLLRLFLYRDGCPWSIRYRLSLDRFHSCIQRVYRECILVVLSRSGVRGIEHQVHAL